jgi:circadian clock protein KaiB
MAKKSTGRSQDCPGNLPEYHLRLFIAGDEPNSVIAKASLDKICMERPDRRCRIEIVDVLRDSRPALEENILVTPALVIRGPERRIVIFGNLADTSKVLATLRQESEIA